MEISTGIWISIIWWNIALLVIVRYLKNIKDKIDKKHE